MVEPYSTESHRLRGAYQSGGLTLLAPDLIYAEMGNIVWKKHRFQGLAATDAQLMIDAFRTFSFITTPTAALLDEAYRLAVAHQRTVYDAMYIALSVREKCPFVTADEKLVNALKSSFPDIVWIANWP
jgi:predicted nucleic acid-binding protein